MRLRARLAILVVAALVAATTIVPLGCGGDDVPLGPTPTPVPSGSTPTPTPVPTPSVQVIELVTGLIPTFDVGAGDEGFLVAWQDDPGAASNIRALRLGADGTPIDIQPFLVSVVQAGGYLADPTWTSPAVGFDGAVYGVAYAGTGTVQGSIPGAAITAVQVGTDASVGSPTDLAETAQIGTCESLVAPPPAIAGSSATSFAAIWPQEEGCAGGPVIDRLDGAFAVVQGAGFAVTEIDDLLPPIGSVTVVSSAAAVASSGTTTVGTWTEMTSLGSLVSVEVAVLTSSGPERVQIASAGGGLVRPAIASDGSDYLVVWQSAPDTISGARFRPGVGSLDGASGFVIAQADRKMFGEPRVAYGDGTYLVAWTSDPGNTGGLGNRDLNAAGVTTEGTVGAVQTLTTNVNNPTIGIAFASGTFVIPFATFTMRSPQTGSLNAVVYRP